MLRQKRPRTLPPGYRISIGAQDPEGARYAHRFGGPFPGAPTCLTCGKAMHLIFLIDLTDPRLTFIVLPDIKQLPLVSCLSCSPVYEPQYFAIQVQGSLLEALNQQPGQVIGDYLPRPLKQHPIGLRGLRKNEYPLTLKAADALIDLPEPKHQLGGLPLWLQEPVEVTCPRCYQSMQLVAMFNDDPSIETGAERPGVYLADSAILYFFCCNRCLLLGTVFQSL